MHFQNADRAILLLGSYGECDAIHFGGSQYAKMIVKSLWGLPPLLNMEEEKKVQQAIREIVEGGLVESAHDLSDGGFAVTLAECCFGPKEIGACVYLDEDGPLELALFHEAPSRILISTKNPKAIQQIALQHRLACLQIGRTKAGRFEISNRKKWVIDCDVNELKQPWANALERLLTSSTMNIRADKFHDECGVVAIYGHPEAANLAYLGLYALQHRGQESAGICTSDGRRTYCHKDMGHVADIFTPSVVNSLPGELAIGHTRYSTAGDTVLLNAQPFSVECNKGQIAVAHNGNITNAAELRSDLEREGSIFQASSDTEVILHLVARSRERELTGALREALLQLEGAFSLVFLANDRIIVARDPHGFRPLAFGQMKLSGGRTSYIFASETCAFDLIDAMYLNDVQPGEMVAVGPEGMTRERYAPEQPLAQCVFEHVYFARPDSHRLRPPGAAIARKPGPPAGAEFSR